VCGGESPECPAPEDVEEGTSMSRDRRWTRTCSAKGPRAVARHRVATNPGDVFGFSTFSRLRCRNSKQPRIATITSLMGARQAEALQRRSCRAPLAISQSPYRIFQPESIRIFVFQPFFFPFFCLQPALPWMKSKKSRLQPAEVETQKLQTKWLKFGGEKI